MIILIRSSLPDKIQQWLEERQSQYDSLRSNGESVPDSILNSYRHKTIKQHLQAESHNKCLYCESKVTHVDYGDVEHLLPKQKHPHLRLTYSNLAYVCSVCNGNKSDYDNPATPLLNPYQDDPSIYLQAYGPMLTWTQINHRGRASIHNLKLNRASLLERRTERLEQLLKLIDAYLELPPSPKRDLIQEELLREAEADKEFSFVIKSFLASKDII